jgi:hypothetical protein
MTDVLTSDEVNEIADAPAGVLSKAVELATKPEKGHEAEPFKTAEQPPSAIHVASVRRDGKVSFEDTKDLKEFVR